MKIKQLAKETLMFIAGFIGLVAIITVVLGYVFLPLFRYIETPNLWAPTENKILTAMSQHTPMPYKNEYFTVVQYDYTTHKVLLKNEKGQLIVHVAEFYQP